MTSNFKSQFTKLDKNGEMILLAQVRNYVKKIGEELIVPEQKTSKSKNLEGAKVELLQVYHALNMAELFIQNYMEEEAF